MTREEAIKFGKRVLSLSLFDETHEFCEIAIEALEQKPCEDVISRQAVIDSLHSKFVDGFDSDRWWNSMSVLYAINKVPSVSTEISELLHKAKSEIRRSEAEAYNADFTMGCEYAISVIERMFEEVEE